MSTFQIDFFELMFLAEACIPPRPIARSMFFQDLSDKYYHSMSEGERLQAFNWLQPELNLENEDSKHFIARFDPENQFIVSVKLDTIDKGLKKKERHNCYLYNGEYHLTKNRSIVNEFITNVEKIKKSILWN